MESHRFSSRTEASDFLRVAGFTSWPNSPDFWIKKDDISHLFGDIEEREKGIVVVVIHPGTAVREIVEGRERQLERKAQFNR